MGNIQEHRQNFRALNNKVYCNFGGQGPLPTKALETIIDTYHYIQELGPFSLEVNAWISKTNQQLREAIASLVSVSSQQITLTENVTSGCNIVLWGIDWQAGDEILMSDCEHPGIIAIIQEIARRFQVKVTVYPLLSTLNLDNSVSVIEQYLQPRTRLLVLSHLLWNTGQLLPLADIVTLAHQHSVAVLADAAQSVGSIPLNLAELGVDFYAFTGHKWLCGPAGVGGLYISPNSIIDLHPTFIGWRGVNFNQQGKPIGWKDSGQRFEIATSAYPLYAGLICAIALHQDWGTPQQRYNQICKLSNYLWLKLGEINQVRCLKTSPPEAGLVSFVLEDSQVSPSELVALLEKRGFQLRTLSDPSCIRACVHYFTLPEELDRLVEAIREIIEN